jgi:CheY-like chemotaxis protein
MAKVLVVDDSLFQRDNIRYMLEMDGHAVLEASNGREALELVGKEVLDCILLDIMMPGVDGWHVLTTLQQWQVRTPVVMLTADIQESTRQRCLAFGAVAVVQKPVDIHALCHLVNQVTVWEKGA